MKKLVIIITIILLSSCTLKENKTQNKTDTWSNQKTQEMSKYKLSQIQKKEAEDRKSKIDTIRKKLTLKWLILKWDINLQNQDYTSALIKFIQIHREIPNDQSVMNSLWEIYYNLKNFKKSYSYFSQIKNYNKLDKDLVVKALISSVELTDKNIDYIINELDTLWLKEQKLFYYKNSVRCKQDFSYCKQKFQDYFNEEIVDWSWVTSKRKIIYPELADIKTALENYKHFKIDDLSYKWALISWAYFKNWLYPIAIVTSKEILKDKKDYKSLLKIVAKSYYQLWNYIEAKIYIIKYNKLVKDDYEASYFLWIIYGKLHEYILSTIHLQNALKIWYPDTLDINKRILLNYHELWEVDRMLGIFKKIIDENYDEINEDDYELAIYYHILNNELDWAKEITSKAIERFPNSEVFNWYMWWILMEQNSNFYVDAWKYIDKALEINKKNPMINLVKWKLEIKLKNIDKAFIYFKKTVSIDPDWEFWKIAKDELNNIKINKSKIKWV